jgi:hypothetical protein
MHLLERWIIPVLRQEGRGRLTNKCTNLMARDEYALETELWERRFDSCRSTLPLINIPSIKLEKRAFQILILHGTRTRFDDNFLLEKRIGSYWAKKKQSH